MTSLYENRFNCNDPGSQFRKRKFLHYDAKEKKNEIPYRKRALDEHTRHEIDFVRNSAN